MSLIYTDTNYGIKGLTELRKAAIKFDVCFGYIKRININDPRLSNKTYEDIVDGIPIDKHITGKHHLLLWIYTVKTLLIKWSI